MKLLALGFGRFFPPHAADRGQGRYVHAAKNQGLGTQWPVPGQLREFLPRVFRQLGISSRQTRGQSLAHSQRLFPIEMWCRVTKRSGVQKVSERIRGGAIQCRGARRRPRTRIEADRARADADCQGRQSFDIRTRVHRAGALPGCDICHYSREHARIHDDARDRTPAGRAGSPVVRADGQAVVDAGDGAGSFRIAAL